MNTIAIIDMNTAKTKLPRHPSPEPREKCKTSSKRKRSPAILENHVGLKEIQMVRNLREKMMDRLYELVPDLALNESYTFVQLIENLHEAMRLLLGPSNRAKVTRRVPQFSLPIAQAIIKHLYYSKRYRHVELEPLLISLLDCDHPLSYESLRAFDVFLCGKRFRESSFDMIGVEIKEVFKGDTENAVYKKMNEWVETKQPKKTESSVRVDCDANGDFFIPRKRQEDEHISKRRRHE